jgi:hypothetical protein
MGQTYHGESMVKSNFYTRLDTKENQISLDSSLGLIDQYCCAGVSAKIGQRSVESGH